LKDIRGFKGPPQKRTGRKERKGTSFSF